MAKNLTPPYWAPVTNNGAKLADTWQGWITRLYNFVNGLVDYTNSSISAPVTGFNITVIDGVQVVTLNPAGTLATGTIKMPPNPIDGQQLQVSSTQIITSLTVSPNTGQTVKNAPTTIATAGTGFAYYYNQLTTTWFRIY